LGEMYSEEYIVLTLSRIISVTEQLEGI